MIIRSLIFFLLTSFASGASAQSLNEQLRECAALDADAERLGCYDAISEDLAQRVEESFGQEDELAAEIVEEAPDSLTVSVAEIAQGPAPDFKIIITLENGQIWRQTDVNRVYWEQGEQVEITRGLFGSFFMRSTEGGRRIRVTRAN